MLAVFSLCWTELLSLYSHEVLVLFVSLRLQSTDTQWSSDNEPGWPGLVVLTVTDGRMNRHFDAVSGCEGAVTSYM